MSDARKLYNIAYKLMSDKDLHAHLKSIGCSVFQSRDVFLSRLPEVNRRLLYKRYGFDSTAHYASKIGGMNKEHTQAVLHIGHVLADEDWPRCRLLFETGEVGWSKFRAIISWLHLHTDEEWSTLLRSLPKSALEEYVRGVRREHEESGEGAAHSSGKAPSDVVARVMTVVKREQDQERKRQRKRGRGRKRELGRERETDGAVSGLPSPTVAPSRQEQLGGRQPSGGNDTIVHRNKNGDRVIIHFTQLEADIIRRYTEQLRKKLGKNVSIGKAVQIGLATAMKTEPERFSYVPVIHTVPATNERYVDTHYGRMEVKEQDLEYGAPECAPIDLQEERSKVRHYVARTEGADLVEKIPGDDLCVENQLPDWKLKFHLRSEETPTSTFSDTNQSHGGDTEQSCSRKEKRVGRHIYNAVDRYLYLTYGGYCAYPGCQRKAKERHHIDRFKLEPSHAPDRIVPFCELHHQLAHYGLIKNEQTGDPARFRMGLAPQPTNKEEAARARVDLKWREHRMGAV